MQIPCTNEAPFSSLLSRNGYSLPWQDILGLEVDDMDQAVAYWQVYMRAPTRHHACKNTPCVAQTIVPSRSHHDVPEEFKKKTPILGTLRDLSGLRRVFAGFCKFQVVLDAMLAHSATPNANPWSHSRP